VLEDLRRITTFAKEREMEFVALVEEKMRKAKAIRFSALEAICRALQCQPGDVLAFREEEGAPERIPNQPGGPETMPAFQPVVPDAPSPRRVPQANAPGSPEAARAMAHFFRALGASPPREGEDPREAFFRAMEESMRLAEEDDELRGG